MHWETKAGSWWPSTSTGVTSSGPSPPRPGCAPKSRGSSQALGLSRLASKSEGRPPASKPCPAGLDRSRATSAAAAPPLRGASARTRRRPGSRRRPPPGRGPRPVPMPRRCGGSPSARRPPVPGDLGRLPDAGPLGKGRQWWAEPTRATPRLQTDENTELPIREPGGVFPGERPGALSALRMLRTLPSADGTGELLDGLGVGAGASHVQPPVQPGAGWAPRCRPRGDHNPGSGVAPGGETRTPNTPRPPPDAFAQWSSCGLPQPFTAPWVSPETM